MEKNIQIIKTNKTTNNIMKKTIFWSIRLIPAIIMLQTLFFKFTAAPESVYIFSQLGLEPYGRIGVGVLELLAAALILVPKTSIYGAGLSLGLMGGAIFSHLTKLGIVIQNDGGTLFILALLVAVFSIIILWVEKAQIFMILNLFKKKLVK